MNDFVLTGLDGSNPLAFLAALGALVALDDAPDVHDEPPRLAWRYEGAWRPVLRCHANDADSLLEALDADRRRAADSAVIRFTYADGDKVKPDLKPSPHELRGALSAWAAAASPWNRRDVDWMLGLIGEGVVDNNGRGKPSALHFTAGQQLFLKNAIELVEQVTPEDLREALFGPWTYSRQLPVMGWDNTESRDYALRATNPSGDKKTGVPGADWLALRGLTALPNAAIQQRQVTAGVRGGWKDGALTWALWTAPLPLAVVRAVLTRRAPAADDAATRARLGVGAVFAARILRSDQGGYGASPAAASI